jgi:catechol 2,3-dioxygenase-like lactoylglutathione lyase family enzyme
MAVRMHVHLKVADLNRSVEFCRRFFGTAPVKEKLDQVKFLADFAPINLALTPAKVAHGERPALSHLGIEVESNSVVKEHLSRVKASGIKVREQLNVNCCYANQTKFWVMDPDGVEWEVYHLNYDLVEKHGGGIEAAKPRGAIPIAIDPASC